MTEINEELLIQLTEKLASFKHDPSGYINYSFPWGVEGRGLEEWTGEKKWQKKISGIINKHLTNKKTRHEPLKIAVASGHGIGKSGYLGMISSWAKDTFVDTRGRITANTEGQLRATTVPELKKWGELSITSDFFDYTASAIKSKDNPDSWRIDIIPWSESNPAAFAGLHNAKKRILIIFDEASNIADIIWETIEGALTDEDTEIIWLAFGNPLSNKGRFRECWRKFSRDWITFNIDSRDVEGTNTKQINKWLSTYGEDSDFFRSRVKGVFPNASANQFYPTDLVEKAQGLHLRAEEYNFAPKILACDPAWTGDDDTVIAIRQGNKFEILEKIPKNDNDVLIANKLARYEDELRCDAVFVDGGYGTGIISAGRTMNRDWNIVWFGGKSSRKDCLNKRAEMFVEAKDWLSKGGSFKDDQDLYEELLSLETLPDFNGIYKFPPKDIMKKDLGRSPNCLDTLGLTFAMVVMKKNPINETEEKPYDPMDRA